MAQRYTDPIAIEYMRNGKCPECGLSPYMHGGWGSGWCTLSDFGVADRINEQIKIDGWTNRDDE